MLSRQQEDVIDIKNLEKWEQFILFRWSHDAEHLEHLREMRDAQAALQKILDDFKYDNKRV